MSALGDKDFAEIFFCFDAMNHSGQRGRIWCLAEHGSGSQGQDRGDFSQKSAVLPKRGLYPVRMDFK